MIPATLVRIDEIYTLPPQIIGLWNCPNVPSGTDSTSLVSIALNAPNALLEPYSPSMAKRLRGKAYAIDLRIFSVSSLSNNFAVHILDRDDISLLNTVNDIGVWDTINRSTSEVLESPFTIKNRDDVQTNQIYFYFDNGSGLVDTGLIEIELTYFVLQDRLDNQF
jgi:hypothetical protein